VVDSRDGRISCLESSRSFLYHVVMVFTLVMVGIIVLLIFVRKAGEIFQRKERFLPWLRFETRIRLTIR
jgi:hypothetical protein